MGTISAQRKPQSLVLTLVFFLLLSVDLERNGCAGAIQYYDQFAYDNSYYYLPDNGDQVKASTNNGWVYQYYTDFPENGALISSILTRVDGKRVKSVRFVDNFGKQYTIGGNYDDSTLGTAKGLTINLATDERIIYLLEQGDDNKLCRFYLELEDRNGNRRSVELGATGCGGDQSGTADVASGLIGGFFGRTEADPPFVLQLGILFLQNIRTITQDTNSITDYPSEPALTYIDGYAIDNRDSGLLAEEPYAITSEEGQSYSYGYSQTWEMLAGIAVSATYKWSTVTGTSESEVGGDISFEYGLSSDTSVEKSKDSITSSSLEKTFCCPPYYYCKWGWYQGAGVVPDTEPATAGISTTVTFTTGYAWTLQDTALYSGVSYDSETVQIAETTPQVEEGEDPFAICNSGGRKVLGKSANHGAQNFTLNISTYTDEPIQLLTEREKERIQKRLEDTLRIAFKVEGDIDLNAILKPFFDLATVPAGTRINSVYKGFGVVTEI